MTATRPQICGFVKVGKLEHCLALLERGSIRLRSLEYFRRGEDGKIRYDADEGLLSTYRGSRVKVDVSVMGKTVLSDVGGKVIRDLRVWMPSKDNTFVYSLTALRRMGRFPYHTGFHGFGDWFVLIKKPEDFHDRLTNSAIPHATAITRNLVEYVSRTEHAGEMGAFRKFDDFAWQNEYRMAVEPVVARPEHLDLSMGSLADIAELLPIKLLPHLVFSRA